MNDNMRIEIESASSVEVTPLDEELEKPEKGVARFTVSLDPPIVISRKVLIYPDGRVYLAEQGDEE